MAELAGGEDYPAGARRIPASTQLLAVAWLRWRMFANSLRARSGKSQTGSMAAAVVLRMMVWPVLALMAIGPIAGSGFFAWTAIAKHHPERLPTLLAGVFLLWQFISINGVSIAANVSSFDPSSLIRFPLPFGRYLVLRLMLGLLTPSTVVGCLALLAAAIGIGIADPSLAPAALVVLAVYALMNIFFTRMLAAWVDRWLATRRAREIFGALTALFFVGIQVANLHRISARSHGGQSIWLLNLLQGPHQFLEWLPPGFAASSILLKGDPLAELGHFAALLAWTGVFLAVFAFRLRKQFLGEYLSDGAPRSVTASTPRPVRAASRPAEIAPATAEPERNILSPVIAACLRKEWLYLRYNGGQVIGMLMPLAFVFILSKGAFAHHPGYFLPGAVGYVLMGLLPALYNVFGADGGGVQLYLLAPVRLRDVILAKNLSSLMLIAVETMLAWGVVLALSRAPISLAAQVSAGLWTIFLVGANLALGTLRSIQAPRKFVPGQTRQMRTPTNRTSGLLVIAVFFGCMLVQVPVTLLCSYLGEPWLGAILFAPLAAAAVGAYVVMLQNADEILLSHRDLFAEELCGV